MGFCHGSTLVPRRKRHCTLGWRCGVFVGIDLGREPAPDETTVCRFRHLLEQHDLLRSVWLMA